jgi:hypothetical protein
MTSTTADSKKDFSIRSSYENLQVEFSVAPILFLTAMGFVIGLCEKIYRQVYKLSCEHYTHLSVFVNKPFKSGKRGPKTEKASQDAALPVSMPTLASNPFFVV